MLKTTVREHLMRRDSNNNTCDNDVAKRRNALRVSDKSNELVESRVVESRNERNRGERERDALAHAHARTQNSCKQGRRDVVQGHDDGPLPLAHV
jgi:hypothetical protein